MTTVHDGKTWTKEDSIDPLGNKDQYQSYGVKNTGRANLGIDTEMLLLSDNKILWPHLLGLPQERAPHSLKTGSGLGYFDFHGDGYATELNIKPFTCLDAAMENLSTGLAWAGLNLKATKLFAPPIYEVPKAIVDSAPDEVKMLGCMPSSNVYGDKGEPTSLAPTERTTGCHLHVSHPILKDPEVAANLVRWADILVGCLWTYIAPTDPKEEAKRRLAYGRAGEFRLKNYSTNEADAYSTGVEYRVLPGTVMNHPAYFTFMFNLYRSAMRLAATKGQPYAPMSAEAQKAINTADRALAKSILRQLPWADGARALIRWFRRVRLEVKDIRDWSKKGSFLEGHITTYRKENSKLTYVSGVA